MNEEENLLAQIRWVPVNPNPNGEYGYGQLPSLRSEQGIFPCNEIKDAIFLLVNNGYRVEKIIRNDESFALSK